MVERNERKKNPKKRIGSADGLTFWHNNVRANDSIAIDNYGRSYADIYGATGEGEWGENWDPKEVSDSLRRDLLERKEVAPVFITAERTGRVHGFALGYAIDVSNMGSEEIAFSVQSDEEKKKVVSDKLKQVMEDDKVDRVLYVKELALAQDARGGFEKLHILMKALSAAGKKEGAKKMIFWTSKKKRFFPLAVALGGRQILELNDDQENVYFDVPIDYTEELFSRPSSELMDMLAEQLGKSNR